MPYPPSPPLPILDPWLVPCPSRGGDLLLRLPRDGDVNAITAACQDPDIQRFALVPSPYTVDDARGFVAVARQAAADGSGLALLVSDPHSGEVLASVGLKLDWRDVSGEIGYWTAPNGRRQGVVTATAHALCAYGFEVVGLPRLTIQAAATNAGSLAVARRLGFAHEGVLRDAGVDGPTGDRTAPRVDMHVFGLLPGELPAVPRG